MTDTTSIDPISLNESALGFVAAERFNYLPAKTARLIRAETPRWEEISAQIHDQLAATGFGEPGYVTDAIDPELEKLLNQAALSVQRCGEALFDGLAVGGMKQPGKLEIELARNRATLCDAARSLNDVRTYLALYSPNAQTLVTMVSAFMANEPGHKHLPPILRVGSLRDSLLFMTSTATAVDVDGTKMALVSFRSLAEADGTRTIPPACSPAVLTTVAALAWAGCTRSDILNIYWSVFFDYLRLMNFPDFLAPDLPDSPRDAGAMLDEDGYPAILVTDEALAVLQAHCEQT